MSRKRKRNGEFYAEIENERKIVFSGLTSSQSDKIKSENGVSKKLHEQLFVFQDSFHNDRGFHRFSW